MSKRTWLPRLVSLGPIFIFSACSQAFWQGVAQGAAAASGSSLTTTSFAGKEILVFGGEGHKTFLGCLTCSEYDTSSLYNKYGNFGSSYSATSIFNRYSEFGSAYSSHSACNKYASDPPVLVDRGGNFYGRLTMNKYHGEAITDGSIVAWLTGLCTR